MKSRVIILVLFFCGLFSLLIARAFSIQLLPQENLERLRKTQYLTMVSLPPQRGKILDRNQQDLATTLSALSLYADPGMIEKPRRLAKKLSPLLEMPAKEIYEKLKADKRFIWLRRQLDLNTAATIRGWNEPGLRFVEEGKRAYPNQNLLSQVLGLVGSEGNGLEGLEKKYDLELRGERKAIMSKRDARGRPLVVNGQLFELSGDGATIETTIDKEIQYELERQLEAVVHKQDAEKAMGIIMDPATGEILAMGSYPSFDPSEPRKGSADLRRNRVVSDIFEPGSTFKVVTVAAALHTGHIQPNTRYFCENGKFQIGKRTIHEAESDHKYGWMTLAEILEHSSNIGTTKVAFEIGQKPFKEMISNFGFGSKTGIDFGGEASGLVNTGEWNEHLLSNVSFGHGVGVTALQMATVYSTIANGGKLMRPFLVKRVIDSDNHLIEERAPDVLRQVLTQKEASTLTMMLTGATADGGTGTMARVDGYPVAGKTGTAQKVNPTGRGYLPHAYVSSFAGFVPANNPQFTIYIMIDNPKHDYYGAQVAAPIFKHLASFALHKKGFMPIYMSEKSMAPPSEPAPKISVMEPGRLSLIKSEKRSANSSDDIVPDFSGLTIREVAQLIKTHSERTQTETPLTLLGSGLVQNQWPLPGQKWTPDLKFKVSFR